MKIRKLLCLVLAAALIITAFAACGKTENPVTDTDLPEYTPGVAPVSDTNIAPTETPVPTEMPEGVLKNLSICGIPLVKDGELTGLGYMGAAYENGVLTLDNAEIIMEMSRNVTIGFTGPLEIVLVGDSVVSAVNGLSAIVGGSEEPDYASSLTISGDGSLTVTAEGENTSGLMCAGPIHIEGGSLDISGGAHGVSGEGGAITYAEGMGVIESTDTRVVIGKLG